MLLHLRVTPEVHVRPGTRAVDKVRLAVHRRVPTFASSLRELELAAKRSEAKTAEKDGS